MKKVEDLKPGDVLDDSDMNSKSVITDAYRNCPVRMQGMYQKTREVHHVKVARKYVYITLACYSIVRREKGEEVKVL